MQETLYQSADAGDYKTADAGDTLSDSRCMNSLSDSGCRRHSVRQRMQETVYQTADAGDSLSDSGCRSISFRQRMQETLYKTADAGALYQTANNCLIERLLHPLSDRESPASAV